MKVEIDSKKDNVLHKRTEVQFTAEHSGEPTPREVTSGPASPTDWA